MMDTVLETTEMQALNRRTDEHKDAAANEHELFVVSSTESELKSRSQKLSVLRAWIWECGAILLVLGMLGTMVGILLAAQGQSAAAWRRDHYNVSVNAVVAVLTGLVKGGCMFIVAQVIGQTKWHWFESSHRLGDFGRIDEASRGPWGSFLLLGKLRAPMLARMGALLTIVALAVDPFTQNTIATQDCQILSSNQTAHIPVAKTFTDPGSFNAQDPSSFTDGDFVLWGNDTRREASTPIRASVYSGLYGSATTVTNGSSVYIPCSGSNCSFPAYSTLAVCHKCADVSTHVKVTCSNTPAQGKVFQSPCTYSLPNGQSIGSQPLLEDWVSSYKGEMAAFNPTWALANASTSTVILPNTPGTFTNLSILANVTTRPTCLIGGGTGTSNCDILNSSSMGTVYRFNTLAVECSVFACLRSYAASTVNGNVIETELNRTIGTGEWVVNDGFRPVSYPKNYVELSPDKDCNQTLYGRNDISGCDYRFDGNAIRGLGNFFWHLWNGTVTGARWDSATIDNNIFGALYSRGYTNFSMIDAMMGGIADSMTAVVRKSTPVNFLQPDIHGQVFLTDQCIEIRWAWLSLPAIVACATLILLTWTILLSTASRDQPIWKSSTLPILFYGLDATNRANRSSLLSLGEMENKANRMWTKPSDRMAGSDHLILRSGLA